MRRPRRNNFTAVLRSHMFVYVVPQDPSLQNETCQDLSHDPAPAGGHPCREATFGGPCYGNARRDPSGYSSTFANDARAFRFDVVECSCSSGSSRRDWVGTLDGRLRPLIGHRGRNGENTFPLVSCFKTEPYVASRREKWFLISPISPLLAFPRLRK